MYKNFLQVVASFQISEGQNPNESSSNVLQLPKKKPAAG